MYESYSINNYNKIEKKEKSSRYIFSFGLKFCDAKLDGSVFLFMFKKLPLFFFFLHRQNFQFKFYMGKNLIIFPRSLLIYLIQNTENNFLKNS